MCVCVCVCGGGGGATAWAVASVWLPNTSKSQAARKSAFIEVGLSY